MGEGKHTRRINTEERNTAIHEAGHAVAHFFLGQRIRRVSIVAAADSLGHVKPAPLKFASEGMFDDSLRGIDRAEKTIVSLYAGGLAQRKFEPHSRWRQSSGHDYEVASELFSHLDSADDEYNRLYSKLLWRRAELLVGLRWREINAVADELVRHRTLDNAGVRDAILGARGLKPLDREIKKNQKKEIGHGQESSQSVHTRRRWGAAHAGRACSEGGNRRE